MLSKTPRTVFIILIFLFLVITTVTVYSISMETRTALKVSVQEKLMSVAGIAAYEIDGDSFARLHTGDENTVDFIRIRDQLYRVKEASPDLRFIYTMRKNGDAVEFVVDGDYGYSTDAADIGQKYPQAEPELLGGFSAPSANAEFTTDQWGTVLSGFSPIRDSTGAVVGIVGVDIDSSVVMAKLDRINLILYLVGFIAMSFVAMGIIVVERRRALDGRKLEESEKRYRLLFECAHDCILILEAEGEDRGKIIAANTAAAEMHGYSVEEMLTKNIADLNTPQSRTIVPERFLRLLNGEQLKGEVTHVRKDGTVFPLEMNSSLLDLGTKKYILAIDLDITDRKAAEESLKTFVEDLERKVTERTSDLSDINMKLMTEIDIRIDAEKQLTKTVGEKEVLLREVHHRVKNNLQIIISLFNLQSRYITDETTLAAFKDNQNRVRAMALVHEKLYQSTDISKIDLDNYIRFLGSSLFQVFGMKGKGITLTMDIRDISLAIDTAIPFGLIINELISNSLKYAFPDGRKGEISLAIQRENSLLTILFKDNGVGIPEDFDWRNAKSLGLRLVISLVEQLDGTIELDRTEGTAFTIVMKEKE
jgi:PAS domain S-box-containing protein